MQPKQELDLDELAARLPDIRAHLIACWDFTKAKYVRSNFHAKVWRPRLYCSSAGFCRHTSLFLQRLLLKLGFGDWKCAGGTCFDHLEGHFAPHWWLERDGIILDLTADQFDFVQIVLCEAVNAGYRRQDNRSHQSNIAFLGEVVGQWEGSGFGFWDDKGAVAAITASYEALVSSRHSGARA